MHQSPNHAMKKLKVKIIILAITEHIKRIRITELKAFIHKISQKKFKTSDMMENDEIEDVQTSPGIKLRRMGVKAYQGQNSFHEQECCNLRN